jgi:UDP-N-acetylmuramoylalanine--D-glutamate ligase
MPKALIIGFGRSGIAAARLLKHQGWTVTISDKQVSDTLEEKQQDLAGIRVKLGHQPTVASLEADLIVVSPGVPWDIPFLVEAREKGVETIGEMELAWRYLRMPWVGITGTNGKTTTTALTEAIFQAGGLNAPACGNIGNAACELGLRADAPDWIIAEISSYQVESSSTLSPQIGVWTTFTPDHLARHHTLENYYQIKASLLQRSTNQIFNGDDPYLRQRTQEWANAYWTSISGQEALPCPVEKGIYVDDGWAVAFGEKILPLDSFSMVGVHNRQNLLLAVGAARLAGIEKDAIATAVANFPGVPHRLELIRTWRGIHWINDSKATNYDAAQVGLVSVADRAILIAGGEPKEGDDTAWLQTVQAKASLVLLIGEAAPQFAERLDEVGYPNYHILQTLDEAVAQATHLAPAKNAPAVLLSPACASFDQYRSFEHRGEHFRKLCQGLPD